MDDGIALRRRSCDACGHRWFTAQEPEYLVRYVQWESLRDKHGRKRQRFFLPSAAGGTDQGQGLAAGDSNPVGCHDDVPDVVDRRSGQDAGDDGGDSNCCRL